MANRITLYGKSQDPDIKRLKREMNTMYLEFEHHDPAKNPALKARLAEWREDIPNKPVVEILRGEGDGSVFLVNPDEPTLREMLYSENILSVTSYWV